MTFMPTARPVSAEVRAAIEALCTEYVFRLDNGYAPHVTELFADDATWDGPHGSLRGKAELKAVWDARAAWPVVTRHLITNVRLAWSPDDVLHGWISFVLFRADKGQQPLPNPALVAEHIDTYNQDADGGWRFQTRRVSTVFYDEAWSNPAQKGAA